MIRIPNSPAANAARTQNGRNNPQDEDAIASVSASAAAAAAAKPGL